MTIPTPPSTQAQAPGDGTDERTPSPARSGQHEVTVVGVRELTPKMRRVTVHAPTLTTLPLLPAQDVGLMLTDAHDRPVRPRYTLRNVDRDAGTVDLDAILHGHGPGARWFAEAVAGTRVTVVGPRGKMAVTRADWHLFLGDESALPAFAELSAALPAGARTVAVVEVDGAEDELELPGDVHWVHRGAVAPGGHRLLADALAAVELPPGAGQAFLLGESRAVVALRPLLHERGLVGPQVTLKGYWNVGRIQ